MSELPLSKSELVSFLNDVRLAHLATSSRRGKPRVSLIWYIYEDGAFYFSLRLHRVKGRHMLDNPSIALSIATDQRPYRAVCAFGQAIIVKEGRNEWMKRIASRYDEEKSWFTKVVKQPDRTVVMLKPDRILSWDYSSGDSERQEKGESMATPS